MLCKPDYKEEDAKMEYDFVVSLGGNCSAAHNLRFRDMRFCSYPFDWVAMTSNKCVAYLVDGFRNGFCDFLLEKNCELHSGNAAHQIIVRDAVSGFLFPNHFTDKNFHAEFPVVAAKVKRRIKRLLTDLRNAKRVLFVLAAEIAFDVDDLKALQISISESFPNLKADVRVMRFGAGSDSFEQVSEQIALYNYRRSVNDYDFHKTNFEWAFLDDILLRTPKARKTFLRLFSLKLGGRRIQLRLSWNRT